MIHRPRADRILVRWRLAGFAATALAVAGVGLMASAAPAATRHLTLKAEHVSQLNATVLANPLGVLDQSDHCGRLGAGHRQGECRRGAPRRA